MNEPRIKLGLGLFRAAQRARGGGSLLRRAIASPLVALYRAYALFGLGVDLPTRTAVGRRLVIHHGFGLVVHADARIGDDVVLRQAVTIGKRHRDRDAPRIGNRVNVGSGAQILGPVVIGDDAVIGAGAVVLSDVPPGRTAVGNPARLLPER